MPRWRGSRSSTPWFEPSRPRGIRHRAWCCACCWLGLSFLGGWAVCADRGGNGSRGTRMSFKTLRRWPLARRSTRRQGASAMPRRRTWPAPPQRRTTAQSPTQVFIRAQQRPDWRCWRPQTNARSPTAPGPSLRRACCGRASRPAADQAQYRAPRRSRSARPWVRNSRAAPARPQTPPTPRAWRPAATGTQPLHRRGIGFVEHRCRRPHRPSGAPARGRSGASSPGILALHEVLSSGSPPAQPSSPGSSRLARHDLRVPAGKAQRLDLGAVAGKSK